MNRCPITYDTCNAEKYSIRGLRLLSRKLTYLHDFPYSAEEQRQESISRASKMSIQGVQPKVSAKLNLKKQQFEIVDTCGLYILKPQSAYYQELPENEDLTMRMAAASGIEIPFHGLIYSKDGSRTYFIKRFDRKGKRGKLAIEDLAQLAGESRETKYNYSMEKLVDIVDTFCTFPVIEKTKIFRLTIFNYLVGNEDMHLKNFSLISRHDKVELSPAYDLLNTTIALKNPREEIALPIRGKRNKLTRTIFIDYFAKERLQLNDKIIGIIMDAFTNLFQEWQRLLQISFLSEDLKGKYYELLMKRRKILFM
ncbi:MAG: HipA domain-containing protein [bacterium]